MTIHEFAAKYAVPYHVAYKASFRLIPIQAYNRERDYDEQELYDKTKHYIRRRLVETKELYEQYAAVYKSLKSVREEEKSDVASGKKLP